MKIRKSLDLTVSILDSRGERLLGHGPAIPDWDPACQGAWLDWVRRNGAAPPLEEAELRPVYSEAGKPFVSGVTAAVPPGAERPGEATVGVQYFAPSAKRVANELVKQKLLGESASYLYVLSAEEAEAEERAEGGPVKGAASVRPGFEIVESSLAKFRGCAEVEKNGSEGDIPVFVSRDVLSETAEVSLGAGEVEIGGLLLGHVRWDRKEKEAFLEVTAQVTADAIGSQAELRFTPEVWHRARTAAQERDRGEAILGWWHAHNWPVVLEEFSQADVILHRSVFSRAFGLGLLVTTSQSREVKHFLFGWRDGLVQSRDYYLIGGAKKQ